MKQLTQVFFSIVVVALFCSATLAKGFEGVITMTMTASQLGGQPAPMTINIKGEKSMIQMDIPQAGTIKIYTNNTRGKLVFVMEAYKSGFNILSDTTTKPAPKPAIPTGEKKTINGYYCEKYTSTSTDGTQIDMWLTTAMPKDLAMALYSSFTGAVSAMSQGSNTNGASAYDELFKGGLLPVQVEVSRNGTLQSTVTYDKFEQKSISDALFVIPTDINVMDRPAGGMGGR